MSDLHNERPELQYYLGQAHEARAEAMARAGYRAVAAVGRIVRGAGAAVQAGLRAVSTWRDRRAALREILLLDDRMLRDIGLTRADAWAAVDGTLGSRAQDWAAAEAYADIALSGYAVAGCNDNGARQRAA